MMGWVLTLRPLSCYRRRSIGHSARFFRTDRGRFRLCHKARRLGLAPGRNFLRQRDVRAILMDGQATTL
jgi:hypothetical protein